MKKVFLISLLLFVSGFISFGFITNVFAVDITFPIAELGNCNNVQTCKVYCDQPQNRKACTSFAKAKGLNKQRAVKQKVKNEELLAKAKQNLNCDSFESCKALCDEKENYTKCAALLQDQVTSDDRAMFEKYKPQIKEILGCDSIVTCMAFCMHPLNIQKCSELGNKIGGSEQAPQESPEVWCPKAGPGCAWDGAQCICPGTSETPIGEGAQEPGDVWCPRIGPYCVWDGSSCTCWDDCVKAGGKWTGQKCEPPQGTTTVQPDQVYPTPESPEVSCLKSPGCSWTGETCYCTPVQAPQTEPTPSPTVQGVTTNRGLLQQILDFLF